MATPPWAPTQPCGLCFQDSSWVGIGGTGCDNASPVPMTVDTASAGSPPVVQMRRFHPPCARGLTQAERLRQRGTWGTCPQGWGNYGFRSSGEGASDGLGW